MLFSFNLGIFLEFFGEKTKCKKLAKSKAYFSIKKCPKKP